MGLMILGFFAIYLIATVFVTRKAVSWAKANSKRSWLWGGLAAFVMYNLVFWDWIPTVVAHKYYCETQAGFFVYKTPEQWVQENPDLTKEDLVLFGSGTKKLKDFHERRALKSNPNRRVTMINNRIYLRNIHKRNITSLVPIHKSTTFFADINDDQKLAAQITFGSGYRDPMGSGGLTGLKYWIAKNTCSNATYVYPPELINFINHIFALGK